MSSKILALIMAVGSMKFNRLRKTLTVFTAILASLQTCRGFVAESEFIPFQESDGNSRFLFDDDNAVNVFFTNPFRIFNSTYSEAYISGNGLMSFGASFTGSSPGTGCTVSDLVKIMPLWADANQNIDLQGSELTFMETKNTVYLSKIAGDIRRSFSHHRRIILTWMFVVTWKNVASHAANQDPSLWFKRNTFQLVLATNEKSSFVLFYYNKITWTNDGAAAAGFDLGGGGIRTYKLPDSCTPEIKNIVTTSNMNVPGKWVFQVDTDVIVPSLTSLSPDWCKNGKPILQISPPVVSVMGNIPLLIHGLCLEENADVTCKYLDKGQPKPTETTAVIVGSVTVCPVPFLYSLGKITLNILVRYPNKSSIIHSHNIFVVKEHEFSNLPLIFVNKTESSLLLSAQWDPSLFSMTAIRKADNSNNSNPDAEVTNIHCQILSETVQIIFLEYDGKKWRNLGSITPPLLNNGIHMSPLNTTRFNELLQRKGKILIRTLAITANYMTKTGKIVNKLFSSNSLVGTDNLIHLTIDLDSDKAKNDFFDKACHYWVNNELDVRLDTLLCPKTLDQARLDWRFSLVTDAHSRILYQLASSIYIQNVPSPSGAASQCPYDSKGRLIVLQPSCGRMIRPSPNSVTGYWRHYLDDILPNMYCCKWGSKRATSNKCQQFFSKRPTDFRTNYVAPRPMRIVGDPHTTTFDGLAYTFNGAGEYWMIRYNDDDYDNHVFNKFKMQVRMEPFVLTDTSGRSNASVVTAAVMEEVTNEYEVKVQVVINRIQKCLSVYVDDEPLNVFHTIDDSLEGDRETDDSYSRIDSPWNLQNKFTLYHIGVTVILKSKCEAVITFASGFSFNFKLASGLENEDALNIVGSAGINVKNKVEGLLGNYDGRANNDFKLPNGTLLETNLTMEQIHNNYGVHWLVKEAEAIFMYLPGESYSNFHQPAYRPWLMSTDELNALTLPDENLCDGFEDCIFDYLATGSNAIAMGTKGSSALFQEIYDGSRKFVGQCELPSPSYNGYLEGTSIVVGSSVVLHCYFNYTNQTNKFSCDYQNGDEETTPLWIDSAGRAYSANLFCKSNEESKNDDVAASSEKVKQEISKMDHLSAESSSSTVNVWIFMIGIGVFAVIACVVIVEYPLCKPVKNFFTDKYYTYRVTFRATQDENINLN